MSTVAIIINKLHNILLTIILKKTFHFYIKINLYSNTRKWMLEKSEKNNYNITTIYFGDSTISKHIALRTQPKAHFA